MPELKTLNDFIFEENTIEPLLVKYDDLKQEVIKLVKNMISEPKDFIAVDEFIRFFNITEEDLK